MFFRLGASGMWYTGSQMSRRSSFVSEVDILKKSWLSGAVERKFWVGTNVRRDTWWF
jgi:hypothetical protein